MISAFCYLLVSYLICSYKFSTLSLCLKIPHNIVGKIEIRFLKFVRKKYKSFSFSKVFEFFDNIKCFLCVLISIIIFEKKEIHDITAIISYFGYCFPIFYSFNNSNKNFISVIFTGFLLDKIAGLGMFVAFILSMKKSGYISVSVVSFMIVGMLKTSFHMLLFGNTDYIEMVFFFGIACIAICDNHRLILKLLSKSPTLEKNYFDSNLFNKISSEYNKLCEKCKKHKINSFKEKIISKFVKEEGNIKKKIKEFDKIFGVKSGNGEKFLLKKVKKIKKRFDARYKEMQQEWYKKGFEKYKKYFFKAKDNNKDDKYYKIKKYGEDKKYKKIEL